jgi:hypothetical protein
MARWRWTLADRLGTERAEALASGRTVKFTRNNPPEARFTTGHDDDLGTTLVELLGEGVPILYGWRNSAPMFSCLFDSMDETAASDATMTPVFTGPFARLAARYTAAGVVYFIEDAGTIAADLIADANAVVSTQIAIGGIEATMNRDRTYDRARIGDEIVALSALDNGFDFEVVPIEPPASTPASPPDVGRFDVFASQGSDKSTGAGAVIFEYGPDTRSNVTQVKRQTLAPVNYVTALGAGGIVATSTDPVSVAKYGRYEKQLSLPDVIEPATLQAAADAAIRAEWVRTIAFDPDPANAPDPQNDYWLGDTVRVRARRGALQEDLAVRVNSITFKIDDDGNEIAHTIEVEQAV